MSKKLRSRHPLRQVHAEFPADIERGKEQRGSKFSVRPRNDHILEKHPEMRQEPHAQRADTYPRAAGKLEVFIQPAVKDKSLQRLLPIQKAHGIAQSVVVLLIESGRIQIRPSPESRRNRWAAQARLEFFLHRNELQFHT